MSKSDNIDTDGEVPLFTNGKRKSEYINSCFSTRKPALLINMVRGRSWCFVECDMLPTAGRSNRTPNKILTEDAVSRINKICGEFADEDLRYDLSIGALSTAHGAGFMSFPDMRPEAARRFAERLRPIIMDESNWEDPRV